MSNLEQFQQKPKAPKADPVTAGITDRRYAELLEQLGGRGAK